jgi:rod shape-determining protein MreD
MLKFLNTLAIFVIATLLHWVFIEIFSRFAITVWVMFAFSLIMARLLPQTGGYTFAFFSGLFLDFFGNILFGGYALVFTVMIFIFYRIENKIDFNEAAPQFVITALLNIISVLLYGLLGQFFAGVFLWQGFRGLLAGSFITALLLPVLYVVVTKHLDFGRFRKINENKAVF